MIGQEFSANFSTKFSRCAVNRPPSACVNHKATLSEIFDGTCEGAKQPTWWSSILKARVITKIGN